MMDVSSMFNQYTFYKISLIITQLTIHILLKQFCLILIIFNIYSLNTYASFKITLYSRSVLSDVCKEIEEKTLNWR